jgi:tetratricopeptide (TPR) repeat protein
MRALGLVCFTLALASCANPVNRHNAAKYHDWGTQAERAGDYKLAEQNYERALINARLGHAPAAGISMATYNLGRVKGYLCKYQDAEKLLSDALQLEEKTTGPGSSVTTMRVFELARLQFDRGHYAASVPYFERAVAAARNLRADAGDPIAMADVLDQYASALDKVGRPNDSVERKREAEALRASNPGRAAGFKPVRYDQPCQR